MSISSAAVVRFLNPAGGAHCCADLLARLSALGASMEDFDGESIRSFEGCRSGIMDLHVRDIGMESVNELIAIARGYGISIVVQVDWTGDIESSVPGSINAFDVIEDREIEVSAGRNGFEVLVPYKDAMDLSREELHQRYALPAELIES